TILPSSRSTSVRSGSSVLRIRSRWCSEVSWWNAEPTASRNSGISSAVMGAGSIALSLCCRVMPIGIITGSGTYALPGFESSGPEPVATEWGEALVSRGTFAGVDVLHVSRHGEGHRRLSNLVTHRANIAALSDLGADAVIAVTVNGAVDPTVDLGSLVCFDDLYFLANRLGDGELVTFYSEPGEPRRGHWIFEGPFSQPLRAAVLAGVADAGVPVRDGGVYGHVDGP